MVDTEMLRTIANEHPHAEDCDFLMKTADKLDRLYEVEEERDYYKEGCEKLECMYDALRRDYDAMKQDIERAARRCHPLDAPEKYLWVELNNWYDSCTIANNLEDAKKAAKEDAIAKKQATYLAAIVSKFEPAYQPYTRTDY